MVIDLNQSVGSGTRLQLGRPLNWLRNKLYALSRVHLMLVRRNHALLTNAALEYVVSRLLARVPRVFRHAGLTLRLSVRKTLFETERGLLKPRD